MTVDGSGTMAHAWETSQSMKQSFVLFVVKLLVVKSLVLRLARVTRCT